jgi:hypothetical protein
VLNVDSVVIDERVSKSIGRHSSKAYNPSSMLQSFEVPIIE